MEIQESQMHLLFLLKYDYVTHIITHIQNTSDFSRARLHYGALGCKENDKTLI